ncbi:unnamed protein product, partial [Rotaria magnacalcarata]
SSVDYFPCRSSYRPSKEFKDC